MIPELYSVQTCFEADRSTLVRQLDGMRNAVEDSATEIEMIATERVFDRQVSRILAGEVRAMHRMARELKDLRLAVARARRPETAK
jgi:hypothetical protein